MKLNRCGSQNATKIVVTVSPISEFLNMWRSCE